jgi:hypothetical protein
MLELHASVAVYDSALIRAITESATAEGSTLLDDPALIHVVASGSKGLPHTISQSDRTPPRTHQQQLSRKHTNRFSLRAADPPTPTPVELEKIGQLHQHGRRGSPYLPLRRPAARTRRATRR